MRLARLKMGMTHFVGIWTGENINTVSLIHSKHVALRDLYLETALKWQSAQRFVLDICLVVRIRRRVDPQRQRFSLQTRPLPPSHERMHQEYCKTPARRSLHDFAAAAVNRSALLLAPPHAARSRNASTPTSLGHSYTRWSCGVTGADHRMHALAPVRARFPRVLELRGGQRGRTRIHGPSRRAP